MLVFRKILFIGEITIPPVIFRNKREERLRTVNGKTNTPNTNKTSHRELYVSKFPFPSAPITPTPTLKKNPTRQKYYILCREQESNLHTFRHTLLKRTCIPFHHPGNKLIALYRRIATMTLWLTMISSKLD